MACPSLKQGIITAILCRRSNRELAAPGAICSGIRISTPSFGATLMYQPSCSNLDGLHMRRDAFYIFDAGHLCSKWPLDCCSETPCGGGSRRGASGAPDDCDAWDHTVP